MSARAREHAAAARARNEALIFEGAGEPGAMLNCALAVVSRSGQRHYSREAQIKAVDHLATLAQLEGEVGRIAAQELENLARGQRPGAQPNGKGA